ncbi:DUF4839 domain-containing protein [Garicola koreensis]|uniref:Uncharacterized protein n=1 Tax=Garicola koreensis TaxID=1262554 RepID=A0A7W5TPF7_9MICC|nr:DUF4839 domain-containing protein [Garicola koreensis]MBB3666655.1 hypothetical protein [Garicola koreensis]
MAGDGVKYESRTVRAICGAESRTVSKWEKEGWEIVPQSRGKLRPEIIIRRRKPKTPWRLVAIGGGERAVPIIALMVNGIIREESSIEAVETTVASASKTPPTPSETPPKEPTPAESAKAGDVVLSPESNTELAAVLGLGHYCYGSIVAFAEKYRGQTIAFGGNIGAMNSHDGASMRYDILIGAGDFSEASASGPAFQFRDVNPTGDLHYTGDMPDTIGVGTHIYETAQIDEYEPNSCLFLL